MAKLPARRRVAPHTRCSVDRFPGPKCQAAAEVWIYGPDNEPVPGGWVCRPCGTRITSEYREKLGEEWPLVPVSSRIDSNADGMDECIGCGGRFNATVRDKSPICKECK